jgi:hypothetical protein
MKLAHVDVMTKPFDLGARPRSETTSGGVEGPVATTTWRVITRA